MIKLLKGFDIRIRIMSAEQKHHRFCGTVIGSYVWGSDDPYEPYFVIGYRIGRMFDEDEEDYEEDYPEPGWYIQLSSDYGEVSTPVSDIGRDFFITQDEALQAREDSEEMKRCQ